MSNSGNAITRRAFLGVLAAPLILSGRLEASALPRFAVIDWALLETVLSLGLRPLAAPELVLYNELAVEPPVPDGVADLGLRGALSFERLALLAPDIVYGSNYSAWTAPQIERIAPLTLFDLFLPGEAPLAKIEAMTLAIADDFGIAPKGRAIADQAFAALAAGARRLTSAKTRNVLLVDAGDANHVRVYGADSLFGETLTRLGLVNAWEGGTRYSANAPVGMEALAAYPDAFLAIVGPVPPEAETAISTGALWRALPAVAKGRVAILPPCNAFGGFPAALRLARFVTAALLGEPDRARP